MTEILNKDTLKIIKNEKNNYIVSIDIHEKKIDIRKLFHFDKLHIFKDLNSDLIEEISIDNVQNNSATVVILYKHFFKELGFSQFGICVDVVKNEKDHIIEFIASNNSVTNCSNSTMKDECIILPVETLFVNICKQPWTNKFTITMNAILNINFEISPSIEKLVLQIVHKIFTRAKQFIEK